MKKRIILLLIFLLMLASSCSKEKTSTTIEKELTIATPSGAPLFAVSSFVESKNISVINDTSTIPSYFLNQEYDFIVAPTNVGCIQYKKGNTNYKLAGTITWGNLYFASFNQDFDEISDLNNMDLVAFGNKTINQSLVEFVLQKSGVSIEKIENIEWVADASTTRQLLLSDTSGQKVYLCAEPTLTQAKVSSKSLGNINTLSVTKLYNELLNSTDNYIYTQASLFVSTKTLNDNEKEVKDFLNLCNSSLDKIEEKTSTIVTTLSSLGVNMKEEIVKTALPNCNIKYKDANYTKEALEKLIDNLGTTYFSGEKPVDDFYYKY